MGRTKVYQPNDALEVLKKNSTMTKTELSTALGCSRPTINKLVKELRRDGEPIIPIIGERGGIRYTPKTTKDNAQEILDAESWMVSVVSGVASIGKFTYKLANQARKMLTDNMTSEERKQLVKNIMIVKNVVDLIELEEETFDEAVSQ